MTDAKTKEQDPTIPPPDDGEELWRGDAVLPGYGPRTVAVTRHDVHGIRWWRWCPTLGHRKGEWYVVLVEDVRLAISTAWALHERTVAAAERTLRKATEDRQGNESSFYAVAEATDALRKLGVEP